MPVREVMATTYPPRDELQGLESCDAGGETSFTAPGR